MNTRLTTILAVAVTVMCSCTEKFAAEMPSAGEIMLETSLDEFSPATRATFHSTLNTQGNSIMVYSYRSGTSTTPYFNSEARYNPDNLFKGRWVFCNTYESALLFDYKYYWPDADHALDFFAHYPKSLDNTCVEYDGYTIDANQKGHPVFSCTGLPMTNAGQNGVTEFVYAFKAEQKQPDPDVQVTGDKHSPVGLEFHRPFARITIQLDQAIRSTLKKVTITNVYNSGTCTCNASAPLVSWDFTGCTTHDFVLTSNLKYPEEINNGGIIGGPFLFVPQNIGEDVELQVEYQASRNDETSTVVSVGLRGRGNETEINEWEPGKSYTYMLSLNGAANEVILDVSVKGWTVEGQSETEMK